MLFWLRRMLSMKKGEEEGKGQGQQRSAHLGDMSAALTESIGLMKQGWEGGSGKSKKIRLDKQVGQRERAPTHQFLSSWLLVGLAQILRLAQGQGDILLPGATLWFGRSQGRPKQTVTLSHASLLFSSDTAIYRLRLWIPRLHTNTHVPTLSLRHRNKHLVLKIAVMHLFFPPSYHWESAV